jgi:uncharacterized membrane protein
MPVSEIRLFEINAYEMPVYFGCSTFPVFASAQFIFINTDGLPADTLLFIYLHY